MLCLNQQSCWKIFNPLFIRQHYLKTSFCLNLIQSHNDLLLRTRRQYKTKNRKSFSYKNKMHYYFLLPISRKNIVLASNFRNGDCASVCVSAVSITQKQIAAETSNWVFFMCITVYYLKLFYKDWTKLCVQGWTKEL